MTKHGPTDQLEERLTRALTSLANEVPDNHPYPGVNALRETRGATRPRRRTWVAVTLAAAAVTLAVAVPYQLLREHQETPPTPATGNELPAPPPFVVKGAVVGEPGSERVEVTVRDRKTGRVTSKVDVKNGYSITVARDLKTFYVESHDKEVDCVSRISTFTVDSKGKASTPEPVQGSEGSKGYVYSDLSLSPDGKRLAYTAVRYVGKFCDWPMSEDDRSFVGVLDLESGERKLWNLGPLRSFLISGPKTWPDQSNLTWTLDGTRVIVPWLDSDPGTRVRALDPSRPAGLVSSASEPIQLDPEFLAQFKKRGDSFLVSMEPLRADGGFAPGTMAYLSGSAPSKEFYAVYHRLRGATDSPVLGGSDDPARPSSPKPSAKATPPSSYPVHQNYLVRIDAETGKVTELTHYPPPGGPGK